MVRICLNVLVGIPASGKTTYCQQLQALSNRTFKVVHVCYDTFINIDNKFENFCNEAGLYKIRRQELLSSVEAIISAIKENDSARLNELLSTWTNNFENSLEISSSPVASEDYLFLIDDNNYYRSMRLDWARVAKKLSLGFFETFFNTPLHLALERNQNRVLPVAKHAITRMWTRLEKPCPELFRWEQSLIVIQERVDMASIITKLYLCLEHPEHVTEPASSFVPLQQSKVHNLDVILRKAVSKNISLVKDTMAKHELKTYGQMLHERKKFILDQIRTGEQNVADELLHIVVDELL